MDLDVSPRLKFSVLRGCKSMKIFFDLVIWDWEALGGEEDEEDSGRKRPCGDEETRPLLELDANSRRAAFADKKYTRTGVSVKISFEL